MPEPVELTIDMPPAFATACEALEVAPQEALQLFIDYLSVYAHMLPPEHDPYSVVSTIFKAFLDKRGAMPLNTASRELHIGYVQRLIALIRSGSSPRKKQQQSLRLIDEWYTALTKTSKQ